MLCHSVAAKRGRPNSTLNSTPDVEPTTSDSASWRNLRKRFRSCEYTREVPQKYTIGGTSNASFGSSVASLVPAKASLRPATHSTSSSVSNAMEMIVLSLSANRLTAAASRSLSASTTANSYLHVLTMTSTSM